MSRINLQNDNNIDEEKNVSSQQKKGGFFDADDETEEFAERKELESDVAEKKESAPLTEEDRQKRNKARLKKIVASVAAVMCVMILINFVANSEFIKNLGKGGNGDKDGSYTKLYIYPPDWETDIFTDENYLALKSDIVFSPNGAEFITLDEGSYYRYGGTGLVFMMDYINTIIAGDHEKLNGMFTPEYWNMRDEDGNKREKYEAFPQQKLINVKIVKFPYSDPKYDTAAQDDHYYIVSYNIYRNDGMFRNDIDEYSELAQMITVLIDHEGNGKIANVIDLPGYIAGHMN